MEKSFDYTHDHWQDRFKKKERIITGKIAEYWLEDYCKENQIDCITDGSSPTENDYFDFQINGVEVDCKATSFNLIQVAPAPFDKNKNKDGVYLFFLLKNNNNLIQALGSISFARFEWTCRKVKKGEIITGNLIQRFPVSYFLEKESLISFKNTFKWIK